MSELASLFAKLGSMLKVMATWLINSGYRVLTWILVGVLLAVLTCRWWSPQGPCSSTNPDPVTQESLNSLTLQIVAAMDALNGNATDVTRGITDMNASLTEELEQLNSCVMQITRDIRRMREQMEGSDARQDL